MDPVADENTGGLLPQLPGAQHAVTVPLPFAETAFIHLAAGIPEPMLHFSAHCCLRRDDGPSTPVIHPLKFGILTGICRNRGSSHLSSVPGNCQAYSALCWVLRTPHN